MAACSKKKKKHINTVCGQKVELLYVNVAVHIVTTGFKGICYEPLKTGTEAQAVPDIHYI
jgi:hypothetical protein